MKIQWPWVRRQNELLAEAFVMGMEFGAAPDLSHPFVRIAYLGIGIDPEDQRGFVARNVQMYGFETESDRAVLVDLLRSTADMFEQHEDQDDDE